MGDAKAFQRTRMAPAVSHERGMDEYHAPPKRGIDRRSVEGAAQLTRNGGALLSQVPALAKRTQVRSLGRKR